MRKGIFVLGLILLVMLSLGCVNETSTQISETRTTPIITLPQSTTPAPTTIPPTTFPAQTSQITENRLYANGGIILLAIFGLILTLQFMKKSEKIIEKKEKVILREIEEILPENCPKCGAPFKGRSGDACESCDTIVRAEKIVKTIE